MSARGSKWAEVSGRFKSKHKALNSRCWLCDKPIDYSAPPRTSSSFSADHKIPISLGGESLDSNNLRPSHYGCNARRGNGTRGEYPTSRQW